MDASMKCKNLKLNLEVARSEYAEAKSRFRDLDNKLNMLLVFFAGLIVAISTVISLDTSIDLIVFKKIIIVHVIILMSVSITMIMLGLFPKKYSGFNSDYLVDKTWECANNSDLMEAYIENYYLSIKQIDEVNKKKSVCSKVAFCMLAIAFLVLGISLIVLI